MSKKQIRINIKTDWCKSCGICGTFCPTGAIIAEPGKKAQAVNESACTGCGLCERLCPDLAIEIIKEEIPV